MKMTIYLPDELGDAIASREHLNVSGICQIALRDELGKRGRGPDAARASLADARAALDRIEAALAEPRVTPDEIGLEIIGAWQALARAADAHTAGNLEGCADEVALVWRRLAKLVELLEPHIDLPTDRTDLASTDLTWQKTREAFDRQFGADGAGTREGGAGG